MVGESAFEGSELRRHKRDLMIEPQPPATNDTSPSVSSLERASGSADILEILLVLAREKNASCRLPGRSLCWQRLPFSSGRKCTPRRPPYSRRSKTSRS